jgi:hypothetical protein
VVSLFRHFTEHCEKVPAAHLPELLKSVPSNDGTIELQLSVIVWRCSVSIRTYSVKYIRKRSVNILNRSVNIRQVSVNKGTDSVKYYGISPFTYGNVSVR